MHVRPASLQQVHDVLSQSAVLVIRARLRTPLRRLFLFVFHPAFSETSICCGMSGIGCRMLFGNPAFPNIFSYSVKVYAAPASVFFRMIRLEAAAVGGGTRALFGANPSLLGLPPGFPPRMVRAIH